MEDNAMPTASGPARAPLCYVIRLNPHDSAALQAAEPALAERLGDELINLARDTGVVLATRPQVTIRPDEAVPPHDVEIDAGQDPDLDNTYSQTPIAGRAAQLPPAQAAFLIVDGKRHVTLTKPMYSIGRRRDSDIVVDDPSVSRLHAQLRQRYGRWVIFDLGSSGGTTVNGEPVAECALQPGDVIGLAGVTLIYGEDEGPAPRAAGDAGHTRPLES
jgi:hypothetical protein